MEEEEFEEEEGEEGEETGGNDFFDDYSNSNTISERERITKNERIEMNKINSETFGPSAN